MSEDGISRRGFISLGIGIAASGLIREQAGSERAFAAETGLAPLAPAIIPRAYWQAPAARTVASYGQVTAGFVHHTQIGGNEYTPEQAAGIVRKIAEFHIKKRGWNDVGYNFLIDRYGQIYEGREGGIDRPVIGAQAQGYNTISTGISLVGDFSLEAPPQEALDAMVKLLAWKLHSHGVAVTGTVTTTSHGGGENRFAAGKVATLKRISGHRDGDKTECPGGALYALLPQLRIAVAKQVRTFPKLSCVIGRGSARGRLLDAAGKPTAGTKVALQTLTVNGFETVAEAVSDSNGKWLTTLPTDSAGVLRAVAIASDGTPGAYSRQSALKASSALPRRARGY